MCSQVGALLDLYWTIGIIIKMSNDIVNRNLKK